MTMITQIGGHYEEYVQGQIESGRYGGADEVVADALRLMEERDVALADIREKIAAGVRDLQAGLHCDGDEFMAQLDAELDSLDRGAK